MVLRIPALRSTIYLHDEGSSITEEGYWDSQDQLWRKRNSDDPLVSSQRCQASNFGETLLTRTASEGVDQSEVSTSLTSQWGETTLTKAPGEGSDLSEVPDLPAIASNRIE